MFNLKKEVFSVKSRRNRKRGSKFKLADNIFSDLGSCSSSERSNNRTLSQRCDSRCDVQIGRAEVMSPLGDTVCLVNYYQGNIQ